MDVNGNGDGWYDVSPFGDNGNGAYPANPNLEQSYGYGGAWGYLYFYGVLGGTNTVRSVDLYYVHGRWWHPDMGLFLSPNAKGDYLFGGDLQDPANKGWRNKTTDTPGEGSGSMPPDVWEGVEAHAIIELQCVATFGSNCDIELPIVRDRPDIILQSRHEIYEIKPFNSRGKLEGQLQLLRYLNTLGPGYVRGTTWTPPSPMPGLGNKELRVMTQYNVPAYQGIIFYICVRRYTLPFRFYVPIFDPLLKGQPLFEFEPNFGPGLGPELSPEILPEYGF